MKQEGILFRDMVSLLFRTENTVLSEAYPKGKGRTSMTSGGFAYGVDLGWVSQLEKEGYHWVDRSKNKTDPIAEARKSGADSVRLRLFVNPPKVSYWEKKTGETCMLGYCDTDSVIALSRRVSENGMRLMLDFHYSDHFADPQYQDIPDGWKEENADQMADSVFFYTRDTLEQFKQNGLEPEWIQVGNEINPGILLPMGSMKEAPDNLVRFLNRGYDAVREVFPACKVITHLAMLNNIELCEGFLDTFFGKGGKTDIIGLSHYPYWYGKRNYEKPLVYYLERYQDRFGKPVMIVEVGGEQKDPEGTYELLMETLDAVHQVPENKGLGVFYWEPEAAMEVLPDRYPLGASELVEDHTLQYTRALSAYHDYREREKTE